MEDWSEADVLTQVLAASQQEYLDSLKQDSPEICFSEKSKTENQYYAQQPTKSHVKCKESNASSASTLLKSRHKDTNYDIVNESQFTKQVFISPIVEPVSVVSKIPPQRRRTGEVQNEEVNLTDSRYLPKDLLATNGSNSEQPVVDIVPSECSENINVTNKECSETSSRTRSPTPDASSIKENTV